MLYLWWAIAWYRHKNQLYFLLAFTYRPCVSFLSLFTFLFKWFDLCLHHLVLSYYNGLLFPNLHVCLGAQNFLPLLNTFTFWIELCTRDSFASVSQNLEIDSDAVHCLSMVRWDFSKLHFKVVYPHWAPLIKLFPSRHRV